MVSVVCFIKHSVDPVVIILALLACWAYIMPVREIDDYPIEEALMPMLNVGDVAPDFSVLDHTGKKVTMGDYQGKTVVMWFYPRASTGG
jgi:hypothetical protein